MDTNEIIDKILNDEKSLYIFDEDRHQSYFDKKPCMNE